MPLSPLYRMRVTTFIWTTRRSSTELWTSGFVTPSTASKVVVEHVEVHMIIYMQEIIQD